MRRLTTIWAALGAFCLAPIAEGQTIDEAIELENQGLLVDALDGFEALLEADGNSRSELTTVMSHLSVLRFASGDPEGARDAVMRLLALDPEAALPDSAPPELQSIAERARERWAGRRLRGQLEASVEGEELVVRVRVVDDLMEMVAGAELVAASEVLDEAGVAGSEVTLRAPYERAEGGELEVILVTAQDTVLWEGDVDIEETGSEERPARGEAPRWHRIVAGILLGGGLASVVGGGIALAAHNTSTGDREVRGDMIYEKYRTTAAGGGVAIGLGGAAAVGGLIWLLIHRRRAGGAAADEEDGLDR